MKKLAGPLVLLMVAVASLLPVIPSYCYGERANENSLSALSLVAPELRVSETNADFSEVGEYLAAGEGISRFLNDNGPMWKATVDLRRGVPSLLDGGAMPFIPGPGNDLPWGAFGAGCLSNRCIPRGEVEKAARAFIDRYPEMFMVKQEELILDPEGTVPVGESVYLARFGRTVRGVPVEGASIYFRIVNGNLIQVASSRISPVPVETAPAISSSTAWDILNGYLGSEKVTEKDEVIEPGSLLIVPTTPRGMSADAYRGPAGAMAAFNLAYRLVFRRPGVTGTWEALIDAKTGEILRFVDANRYGKIQGGVYKTDANPVQSEVTMTFPFADHGAGVYSDISGGYPGTSGTSTMSGRPGSAGNVGAVDIVDTCGAISLASDGTGMIDFGTSGGTDCVTPGTGGAGNTHSARTQYYNVAWIKIKAYTYLSPNSWLQGLLTDNVNINDTCNAYWNGSSVNFFRSGGGCGNTGEIPGVSLHEWGHGMDDNDGSGGDSPPVETRADWTAILQTHQSCAGGGFFTSYNPGCGTPPSQGSSYHNCHGYGDCCSDCSGIRDADWAKHASNTPWTAANKGTVWNCSSGSYFGPCGWEDHCESGIATQALWDLAVRDLPAYCGMDTTSAWQLIDRLWYSSMPQMGDMYTCSPPSSDGSGGTSLFNLFRAFDDSGDGTANGTPHAQGIFQAFNRHNIALGAAGDQSNQNQTTCPSLSAPVLTGVAGSDSASLSWGGIAGATRYFVFRNDTSCDSGFVKIATVSSPAASYTDSTAVNGLTSYYRIQAATGEDACVSPMSNCADVTPQPCAGSVILDAAVYNCSSTVAVTVLDSTAPAAVTVEAWSTTDIILKTITLSGSPSTYTGSFGLTSGAAGASEVRVSDGDTLYVRYADPDYCGTPSVNVESTAPVDCSGPVISNVQVTGVTGISAVVSFETDESSTGETTYDTAFPPSSWTASDGFSGTTHSIDVTGLTECTRFYFHVSATDEAGNTSVEDNGGSYYSFKTTKNNNPIYMKTEVPPLAIPDNNTTTGASSVMAVPDLKIIQDLNVVIGRITHTYDADLDMYLVAPDGTTVELSTDNGGGGDNFTDTVFDGEAATPVTSGSAPFNGTYRPEGDLSVLYGTSAAGNWTLKVYDDAGADTGVLESWGIQFAFPVESCPESDGTVFFEDDVYGCSGDSLTIQVQDADLLGGGSQSVEVWSDHEPVHETVSLTEDPPSSATFKGAVPTTTAAPVTGDGLISTSGGKVYVLYTDADDGSGGTDVQKQDDADIDCQGPIISGVAVSGITAGSATVTWTTDVAADSLVVYGDAIPPVFTEAGAALVTSHSISVSGLLPCTTYYFQIASADEFGNGSVDDNGGAYYSFETYGGNTEDHPYPGSPAGIPDQGTVNLPVTISGGGIITDVNVSLEISHTWDGDLDIYLVHPDGTLVELSTDNGGSANDYTGTVFDDSAATPITSGTAPFTGVYRPEGLLSSLNGKDMAGTWQLRVSDDSAGDTGTVIGYNLEVTYSRPCGPSLEYESHSFSESCSGTGSGGDGIIDPGEDVELNIVLMNAGSSDAVNVTASITTTSPDASVTDGDASFPDIPAQASAGSLSPHFTIRVSESASCGQIIPIHFTATCDGASGPLEGDISLTVGNVFSAPTVLLEESFDGTDFPPAGWVQVDVSGTAGNWARSAGTVHPSGGGTHGGAGLAYFNSYSVTSGNSTRLYTSSYQSVPASAASAEISFFMYHDTGYSTNADRIQVQVSADGSSWTNIGTPFSRYGGTTGWSPHSADISAFAGQPVMIGFLGISAYGNDCHIDDVSVSYSTPGCSMSPCTVCVPPSPVSASAVDQDPCVQSGVTVTFTGGSPSTRFDLYVDGSLAQSGISSPAAYAPGDTASHQYVVRAVNANDSCYTESAPATASDLSGGPTKPVITGIVDVSPVRKGLKITYVPGAPAQRHDLYRDGAMVFASFPSGGLFSGSDSSSHDYAIAAVNGSCATFSDPAVATDQGTSIREKTRLDLPQLPLPDAN